jgi:hypothetical protein
MQNGKIPMLKPCDVTRNPALKATSTMKAYGLHTPNCCKLKTKIKSCPAYITKTVKNN